MNMKNTVIYKGFEYQLNMKKEMVTILGRTDEGKKKIADLLINKKVANKLKNKAIRFDEFVRFEVYEEDLNLIFDELYKNGDIGRNFSNLSGDMQYMGQKMLDMINADGEIVNIDQELEKSKVKEENLSKTISAYEQEIKELRNYVYGLKEVWNTEADYDGNGIEQMELWADRKIVVFGGHRNWLKKLKDKFPKWQFVGAEIKSFSRDMIRDKEYIVCNTEFLSHASYFKIMAERSRNQRLLYVRSNKIDLCIKELNVQM